MSRDYAKVSPRFWTGTTGRQIRAKGAEAQVVALYLITSPQANALGLYYLPVPTIQHETGVSAKGVAKALRQLEQLGFAFYDSTEEVVWVPEMGRHQVEEALHPKDKRVPFIGKEAAKYQRSRFYADFVRRYGAPFCMGGFEAPSKGSEGQPATPSEALASPFEAPSEPLRSQEQEQEPEPDHDQEREPDQEAGGLADAFMVEELRKKASKALGRELKGAKGERLDALRRLLAVGGVDAMVQAAVDVDRILREKGEDPLISLAGIPGFCQEPVASLTAIRGVQRRPAATHTAIAAPAPHEAFGQGGERVID